MLVTSVIGILFNVINLIILNCCCNGPKQEKVDGEEAKVKKKDTNVRAAIIHLAGDLIQGVGVFVAAMIIYFRPEWKIADPITTFIFAVLVLFTTVPIFIKCMQIILEYAPSDLDIVEVRKSISEFGEVTDLHIWSLSEDRVCLTVHLNSTKIISDTNDTIK